MIQSTTIQADWMNEFPRYGQEASASGVCDSHNRGWFTSLDGIMVRVGNRAPSNTRPVDTPCRTQMTFPSVLARPGLNCNTVQDSTIRIRSTPQVSAPLR